jgi:hypothetical protein
VPRRLTAGELRSVGPRSHAMKTRRVRFVLVAIVMLVSSMACAPEYAIVVRNATSRDIDDVRIEAAALRFEAGIIAPGAHHSRCCSSSPTPDKLKLSWISLDGPHSQELSLRPAVPRSFGGDIDLEIRESSVVVVTTAPR